MYTRLFCRFILFVVVEQLLHIAVVVLQMYVSCMCIILCNLSHKTFHI